MTRVIDPPLNCLDKLPTPPTEGEERVIRLFHQKLPDEWDIYVQPHLNGLRPDIVLLHPRVGVAVFEVKDWDLAAMHYYAKEGNQRYILMARDKRGRRFSLEAKNPVNQILHYKQELFELYCPRLEDKAGRAVVTAGLIFPVSPYREVEGVFEPLRQLHEPMRNYPDYFPIAGKEAVDSEDIGAIFPECMRTSSQHMSEDTAKDLRGWLREPSFSRNQRQPLTLDARQRELAISRTATGYRRIKGPAGSGKSVVLAARASELAAEGRSVLVVSFNITLLNYLRDLAVRHVAPREVIRREIDFLNFHKWCKRVCFLAGFGEEYKALWRSEGHDRQLVLDENMARLVQGVYHGLNNQNVLPRYDAILVDEGQDFRLSWWQTLSLALKPNGEMVLVADKTQNIYGTAAKWTEEVMVDAGFRGPWAELKASYRLPPAIIPLVRRFAEEFLTEEELDVPEPKQRKLEFSPPDLRWVHVPDQNKILEALVHALKTRLLKRLPSGTAVADITILVSDTELGRKLVGVLSQQNTKLNVLHTFGNNAESSGRKKRAFFQGDGRIKATTIHSFKGWEAPVIIVCVESIEHAGDRALLYTALTRLLDHEHGSCLTVVSSCPALQKYGKSWPSFDEF